MIDRIVLLVLDGLRADMVTPGATPNLWALRQRAAWFSQARSVVPSATRVCTSSVMSGALPMQHGIVGNEFYHRGLGRIINLSVIADVQDVIAADGAAILAPTLDQVLTAAGRRFAAVSGNKAGTCYLMLPDPESGGHWVYNPHSGGMQAATDEVEAAFGPPPPAAKPMIDQTEYLGRVFAEHVLGRMDPDVALMWLAEPDTSLHYRGTAHAETRAALHTADQAVGRALAAIEASGRAHRTAIMAFSDHGQITCPRQRSAGKSWPELPGAIIAGGRCAGVTLPPGADVAHAVGVLRADPSMGMVFSRDGAAGTLPYATIGLEHPRAPDLVYMMTDTDGLDDAGLPGLGWTTSGDIPLGGGMHGALNPGELGNMLMLAMPGATATVREAPAGLIDVAPTALALLGLDAPSMIGRNLAEADPPFTTARHEADGQAVVTAACGRGQYVLRGEPAASGG